MKPLSGIIEKALSCGALSADIDLGIAFQKTGVPMTTVSAAGYIVGKLFLDGIQKQVKAHQVVWLAAGNSIPNGYVIDHINRIKTDNRLSNLRLCTVKENSRNRRNYSHANNPAAKINSSIVREIRQARKKRKLSYSELAIEFGMSKSTIANIIRGDSWN